MITTSLDSVSSQALGPQLLRRYQVSSLRGHVAMVIGGVLLLALLAQIAIPLPFTPVPVTGQTFGVLMISLLFGRRLGIATLISYVLAGAAGLPVFAGLRAGLALAPTSGYLLGMIIAGAIVGRFADRGWTKSFRGSVIAGVVLHAVIYLCGLMVLSVFVPGRQLLAAGVLPFLPGDMIKILLAAAIVSPAHKSLRSWIVILAMLVLAEPVVAASKTFVYCSEGSPSSFNPQLGSDGTTFNASAQPIYNRLVDFEPGGTKVIPALAESWDTSKDGKSVTFKLRQNVSFHTTADFKPTRPFNADDVLFTFNRMLKADHPYHKVSGGTYEYFQSMEMGTMIKDLVKVDPYTVKFVLARPEAPFLANMAMDFASILSAEYGDQLLKAKTPDKIDTTPVGTGPFVFQKYVKDNLIRYEAHPTYFRGRAAIDKLVFSITPDANVRTQKLKRGECHFVIEPAPADLKAMKADQSLNVMEQEGLNIGYLSLNVEKGPLKNVLVRKAINHALNRPAYLEAIYLGNAVQAKNPIPPSMWSYNDSTQDYNYDVEKAKALLKQAGFANGFELSLWTLPVSRPYNPNGKKMGEMIQADLAKVGIKVALTTYDWPTYLAKARNGEDQSMLIGWTGDNGDPDNFLRVLLGCSAIAGGSNYSRWCDPQFEKLVDEARATSDMKKRTELYQKAQKVFKEAAPWVTLAHAKVFRAMKKNVVGYKMSPFGTDNFYGVDLK